MDLVESYLIEIQMEDMLTEMDPGEMKALGTGIQLIGLAVMKWYKKHKYAGVSGKIKYIKDNPMEILAVAAVGVVIAGIITSGTIVYKRYLSKAGRSCKGKSGKERSNCMKQYKINGREAQIKQLRSGLSACSKSKNPSKCKSKVSAKIKKVEDKIKKMKAKIK